MQENSIKAKTEILFLTFANIVSAIIGLAKGIVTVYILGAQMYGVIAVVIGINSVMINFIDFRVFDLTSKLYFRNDIESNVGLKEYKTSVIQIGIGCYIILASFFLILGYAANIFFIHWFTSLHIDIVWIFVICIEMALQYVISSFNYFQRFSEKFFLMGKWQIINSIVGGAVYIGVLYLFRGIGGYCVGALLSASIVTIIVVTLSIYVWTRYDHLPILKRVNLVALSDYRGNLNFFLQGNLLGYIKMFHRSLDVLVVGYFCNDSYTGIYKFARSITDGLYVLYDSINKIYLAKFMKLLTECSFLAYSKLAKRFFAYAGVFTLSIIFCEILISPFFKKIIAAKNFEGVEISIIILSMPFFFVTGIHLWIWPVYIYESKLAKAVLFSILAVVIQYFVGIGVFKITGSLLSFSIGYLSYYFVLYPILFFYVRGFMRIR